MDKEDQHYIYIYNKLYIYNFKIFKEFHNFYGMEKYTMGFCVYLVLKFKMCP